MKAEMKLSPDEIRNSIREHLSTMFVGEISDIEFEVKIEQRGTQKEPYNEAVLKGAKIMVDLVKYNQKTPPVINLREVPDDIPNYKYQK